MAALATVLPAATVSRLTRMTVAAHHRRRASPATMLNTAMLTASTAKATPPCPVVRPRSVRAVGNSGERSCSPTVAVP